mmetsp:Transcript_826/g.1303  ORF Transcript_826/g.1303 Transcript_826/m.1303 type:complete len:224 (-) Transcript_826:6-677(-)
MTDMKRTYPSSVSPASKKRPRPDHWEEPGVAGGRKMHEPHPSPVRRFPDQARIFADDRVYPASRPKVPERVDRRIRPSRAVEFARRPMVDGNVAQRPNGLGRGGGSSSVDTGRRGARESSRFATLPPPPQNPPSLPPRYKEGRRLEPMSRPAQGKYQMPHQVQTRPLVPFGGNGGAGMQRRPVGRGGPRAPSDRRFNYPEMHDRREGVRRGVDQRNPGEFYRL